MTPFLSNNHYLIVGASSITGRNLINYLSTHNAIYSITDLVKNFTDSFIHELAHKPQFIYDSASQDKNQLKNITTIIISPGVPRSLDFLKEAKKMGIPIISEIYFSLSLLEYKNIKPYVVGITGSNGKSTTCALIYHILKDHYKKRNSYLLGNFGIPFITEVDNLTSDDVVILELSSYQLEDGEKYKIATGGIINITPNHLDRYDSFEDYEKTKMNLFINHEKSDLAIIPKEFLPIMEKYKVKSNILTISSLSKDKDSYLSLDKDNHIFYNSRQYDINIPSHLKPLKDNILIAISIALNLNISMDDILGSIPLFIGLEHRNEWVRNIDGITVINDSKATTPQAIALHLRSIPEHTVLIMGGKNKDIDFSYLKSMLNHLVEIVFYGVSGKELRTQLELPDSIFIYDFKEAVLKAFELANKNKPSQLILSPGCTSFDQFDSFVKRGLFFKEVIYEIE